MADLSEGQIMPEGFLEDLLNKTWKHDFCGGWILRYYLTLS